MAQQPHAVPDHAFLTGVRLYNEGAFFEAHEEWETAWRSAAGPADKSLFQGLVQVTAAFYKLFVSKDRASAQRLLERGLAKLDAVPETSHGLDLAAFRSALRAVLVKLPADTLTRADVPSLTPAI